MYRFYEYPLFSLSHYSTSEGHNLDPGWDARGQPFPSIQHNKDRVLCDTTQPLFLHAFGGAVAHRRTLLLRLPGMIFLLWKMI